MQPDRGLEDWSRRHAIVMLGGCGVALATGQPWPVSALALASFAVLVFGKRRSWTTSGRFGPGNLLTTLRLSLAAAMGIAWHQSPGLWLASVLVVIFVLDGLDGAVARRSQTVSEFGAHFDMETDAFLVLAVTLELHQRGQLDAWILSAGLLRYVYVLCLWILPSRGGELPRSLLARYAFAVLIGGLAVSLAFPGELGTAAAALGTAGVVLSFARSFYWSYTPNPLARGSPN